MAVVVLVNAGIGNGGGIRTTVVDAHPFARLFLAIAVVVGVCKLAGAAVRHLGQPPVIGEIAAGILLGPSVLGAVWPSGQAWVFPSQVMPQLQVLAQVGVVLFVFLTGLELNAALLRGRGQLAVLVSHVSIAAPFLLGVLLAIVAYQRFAPPGVGYLPFALFLGVSMSVTALPVLARILLDLGMYHSRIGALVMTCALVADVTAWTLLAVVIAAVGASTMVGVFTTIVLTATFVGGMFAVRPLLARCLSSRRTSQPVAAQVVLIGALLSATITEWVGVHAIFGAFVFGLVLPADNPVTNRVRAMVGSLTATLFLPLFFAYSGLRTQLVLLGADAAQWLWCVIIFVVSVLGKLGGSALAARAAGADWHQSWQIGALMNCRGLTELVVLNIGLDLGVLSPALFAILVLMALLSTMIAAPIVKRFRSPQPGEQGAAVLPHMHAGDEEQHVGEAGMHRDGARDPGPLHETADGQHNGGGDGRPTGPPLPHQRTGPANAAPQARRQVSSGHQMKDHDRRER